MRRRVYILCLIAVTLACPVGGARAESAKSIPQSMHFNRDIRPILSDNCYACHGPDKNKRKGDPPLRLDTKDGLFGNRDGAFPVVPGKVDDSVLYQRITEEDPEHRMPSPGSNKSLSNIQIATIKRWIEQGAPWKGHWAYIVPSRPPVPAIEARASAAPGPAEAERLRQAWPPQDFVRNDIDRFIAARLVEQGLGPSPEADKRTLIRRLYLDLIGLPPTPQQVQAFVQDTSPAAYADVVDQLLSNPHCGERMAVYWLDLVRFADTIGYHSDNPRDI